ncbi:MAG: RidA family protein [Rhodoplanes sp.]|uniref:RidA family protein n=1 Tax=Rhodoplanes sp. TaxID=1968906 RepID=UPI001858E287|nr:RidA family protein [Rhodoplanes sp.]NVO17196.1 RidA family protein [Rhodoplanes sp.]
MERQRVAVPGQWGEIIGYSRAVRAGAFVFVSGTTASGPDGALHPGDAGAQAEEILVRIGAALAEVGASLDDVVETRIYVADIKTWEAVGRAHGKAFAKARPATVLLQVASLISPDLLVEISATAVVGDKT